MGTGVARFYDESYKADADLHTTGQYRFVSIVSTGGVDLTSVGGIMHGVLQNDPNTGQPAVVRHKGISQLIVNGTVNIAIGDKIESAASGKGLKITAAESWWGAIALDAATTDNALIRVVVVGPSSA